MSRHVLTRDGVVVYDFTDGAAPGPTPVPTPGPTPTPTPSPTPPANVEIVPTPQGGAHPVLNMEPGKVYAVKAPRAGSQMMCQLAGTQSGTATYVELTFSRTAGDRNFYATPEGAVTIAGRSGSTTIHPGRWEGDPAGGGVAAKWSPSGGNDVAKFPPEWSEGWINFYSPAGGATEFYLSGG